MRRYKKKELLETADMLVEANEVIGRLCKSNIDGALELLGQCQESAILLGNLIESKGDGYAELVEILENYCENIYQMSIAVSDEEQIRKLSKKIQKQLIYLNNKIQHEIPEDKKEVVFFPYKASMWDSLESVWMAADADEDTDAYVVPIPYYDKNPDGTFREMHYEGDQYPDYVPVTNYEEYDFEERRPDVMFIHNPYDQFNYVTSVHPRFYSGNLKQYTEKLVYIPYFILGEIKPNDDVAIKGMKHFCINEAVKNADKVIVQSEDMRQVYINVLTKESGGSKEAQAYWEKKIDGSGSPKVDKVLRTKKEDLEIPEEWLDVIRKPDGSWKKIIFYNTSVTALLQHDEQMLEKIESVFQTFQKNRGEVALLWRPHPLMESTLVSMRPELWEKYRAIREKYREEGWGIYDDTADMDRAVVLSDVYYGDGSSIVQLYREMRKPVMLQNVNSVRGSGTSLAMYQVVEHKEEWWFLALQNNCIYRMNKSSFNINIVARVPWDMVESIGKIPQYGKIHIYYEKVFILPLCTNRIVVYDMKEESFHYIEYGQEYNNGEVFWDGVELGGYLYLIPCSFDSLLKINMETEEITLIKVGSDQEIRAKRRGYAWGSIFVEQSNVVFTTLFDNKIFQLNLENYNMNVYKSDYLAGGGGGICGDEKNIWIIPQKAERILRWDREARKLYICDEFPNGYAAGEWSFAKASLGEKHLYLLPRDANMCIAVNKEDGSIKRINLDYGVYDADDYYDRYMKFSNVWMDHEKVYIINTRKGIVYCIDDNTLRVQEMEEINLVEQDGRNVETDYILDGTTCR